MPSNVRHVWTGPTLDLELMVPTQVMFTAMDYVKTITTV